jgi:GntR family transcriptional regulator
VANPMYRAIADDLRRRIESGDLPPSSQLPTEIELRERYNASRNTVRDAVKWLINHGLVETRPGQGTFVTDLIVPFVTTLTGDPEIAAGGEGVTYSQEVKARRRQPKDSPPRVEIQDANDRIAAELQLDDDRMVISRHQRRLIDDTPWSMQASYYPMRFVRDGAERLLQATNIEQGTVEYLRDKLGIEQAGYRDHIIVRPPGEEETSFFRLPDDGRVSVIETRRTAYDEDGVPMRLTVSVYPADRNQLAVHVGKVPSAITDPSSPIQPHPSRGLSPGE